MRSPAPKASKDTRASLDERRLKIALAAALFAGLALSPELWLTARVYPTIPVLPFLSIPPPLDYILYGAMLAMLLAIAVLPRPAKLIWLFAGLAIAVALFDQSRWQPWFYQYLIMLIAVGLGGGDRALNTCRLVMVCTYFWSGLQKTNGDFIHNVFPFMTGSMGAILNPLAFTAPLIEIAIGIGLLTRRFRTYAIYGGIAMHAFILLAIGPFGRSSNSIIWPWNVAMICFLIILFWQSDVSPNAIVWPSAGIYQRVVLVLFGIAPLLSFFNLWDGYLSSALYSGVRNSGVVYVTDTLRDRLPKEITAHIYPSNKAGTSILILRDWSMSVLNAGIYPEPRIYKSLARYICTYTHDPSEMKLWIRQAHVLFAPDIQVSYDCPALTASPGAQSGTRPTVP
jgi:hypothetical protein